MIFDRNVSVAFKQEPVLLDSIVQDLQKALMNDLKWLNIAFGRSYKLVQHTDNGDKFIYPAAYISNSEYTSLLPNDRYGNFSWFDLYDPQHVTNVIHSLPQLEFSGAIVFWFDLTTIYTDNKFIYTEDVKNEILQVLTKPGLISTHGRIEITAIYERFENIYKGYSVERIYNNNNYKGEGIEALDRQFFMFPYAGLRFEFKITTRELCKRFIKR